MPLRIIIILACLVSGCADPAAPSDEASAPPAEGLSLRGPATPSGTLEVVYGPREGHPGPRVAEIWLRPSEGLDFVAAQPGPAALAAGKQLIAQAKDGKVRLVLYSADNLNRIDGGVLATVEFTGATPGAEVALVAQRPVFAPPEADEGLQLGPPLALGGP
jgi:hypothetical protein